MDTTKMLRRLLQYSGISGHEEDFDEKAAEMLKEYCAEVTINKTGSIWGCLGTTEKNKKTILLEAHLDRIGLVVSEILDDGFVRFRTLGGVDERILPASEVCIIGKERCFGVIGAVPPHLKGNAGENEKTPGVSDMVIDTGLDLEELKAKISVGDPILLKSDFVELLDGRVSSAALDNRAGMAAIFECLDLVKGQELPVNVCVAFTVGEELGLQGARALVCDPEPDLAIVIDVTHGTTHDSEKSDTFVLGSGADICRGPNLHYEITNRIIALAKEKKIPYEIEVAAGNTGTNAWALQVAGNGIACALISIPIRYMHTTVETADIADVKNVGKLLAEIILGGGCFA